MPRKASELGPLAVERLCLLLLVQLDEPALVGHAPAPNQGSFSSTDAFVKKYGFAFEARHAEYGAAALWRWFLPTVENRPWIDLVDRPAKHLN